MSLEIVSELFKHVSVQLQRLHKLWLWQEQICQSGANCTNLFYFKIHLSGVWSKKQAYV